MPIVPSFHQHNTGYRKLSNVRFTKSENLNVSRRAAVFVKPIEARCEVDNEDVVGAAPRGDAPTTSASSTVCCLPMCVLY